MYPTFRPAMMKFVAIKGSSDRWSVLRNPPIKRFVRRSDGKNFSWLLPSEVVFQWQRQYKRPGDFVGALYYPIVSERVREFCLTSGFSGLEFFRAREVPAGRFSSDPPADGPVWWAMCPSSRLRIDIPAYFGPTASICPETMCYDGGIVPLAFMRRILLKEDRQTDFFGIADLPGYPVLFCPEEIGEMFASQRFKNLAIEIC